MDLRCQSQQVGYSDHQTVKIVVNSAVVCSCPYSVCYWALTALSQASDIDIVGFRKQVVTGAKCKEFQLLLLWLLITEGIIVFIF